ncbi:MAG: EAL domain-containing protein [Nitrosomonas sp.]|nr:EAL domain-containing protein [Nitrosomonas sp.]
MIEEDELVRRLEHILDAIDYPLQLIEKGWVMGSYYNCQLSSVFQPIFDTVEKKTIGHAAYTRSESIGQIASSPWHTYTLASDDKQLAKLDRLCRTIHALNYYGTIPDQKGKLFVNVQPQLLESVKDDHGQAFAHVLGLIKISPTRLVIEIPKETNRDRRLLRKVIQNYHSSGYQIATNFDSASSDWVLELIMELGGSYPDIMRIQIRELLQRSAIAPLIETIHRFGAIVLAYDIETADQATQAIDRGVDYLQGGFFGKPVRAIDTISPQQFRDMLYPDLYSYEKNGAQEELRDEHL